MVSRMKREVALCFMPTSNVDSKIRYEMRFWSPRHTISIAHESGATTGNIWTWNGKWQHNSSQTKGMKCLDYLQEDQRDGKTRSITFPLLENTPPLLPMRVREWLFHLPSKACSFSRSFQENHYIEQLSPVWIWSGRLLVAGVRIAKGDRSQEPGMNCSMLLDGNTKRIGVSYSSLIHLWEHTELL
jgi:hypothetical protein